MYTAKRDLVQKQWPRCGACGQWLCRRAVGRDRKTLSEGGKLVVEAVHNEETALAAGEIIAFCLIKHLAQLLLE